MEYGRLGPNDPGGSSRRSTTPLTKPTPSSSSATTKRKLILLFLLGAALIVAATISAVLVTVARSRASTNQNGHNLSRKPTQARPIFIFFFIRRN